MLDFQNAFGEPDISFEETVKTTLHQLESGLLSTRSRPRFSRIALIAALIGVFFMISITVLAVGSYLGAFDRLREIIGGDRAESQQLQPVEISNVVGELITDEGIKIEIVAVGINANVVDFYTTLEDLTGDRLNGDIRINANVISEEARPNGFTSGAEVIDRSVDGIVTLHSRQVMDQPITGQKLRYSLKGISYDIRSGQHDIDFDLSTLEVYAPVVRLWDTPILPTHLRDIELELEGFENDWDSRISNIGIIEGKLHIQQLYRPKSQTYIRSSHFFLIDPEGDNVLPIAESQWPWASIYFRVDDNGNIISDENMDINGEYSIYREDICEIDLERLSEYKLANIYYTERRIELDWNSTFEINIPNEGIELVVEGLEVELENCCAILRNVRVTQSHVIVYADYIEVPDGYQVKVPSVTINTTNGPITGKVAMFSNKSDDSSGLQVGFTVLYEVVEIWDVIDVDFLDLDSVVSIEIDGHRIPV